MYEVLMLVPVTLRYCLLIELLPARIKSPFEIADSVVFAEPLDVPENSIVAVFVPIVKLMLAATLTFDWNEFDVSQTETLNEFPISPGYFAT